MEPHCECKPSYFWIFITCGSCKKAAFTGLSVYHRDLAVVLMMGRAKSWTRNTNEANRQKLVDISTLHLHFSSEIHSLCL